MTTAHRPTWNSVRGGSEQGGNVLVQPSRQYSSRDMPAHLKLKERQPGQGSEQEQQHLDFRNQLLEKEKQTLLKKRHGADPSQLQLEQQEEQEPEFQVPDSHKRQKLEHQSEVHSIVKKGIQNPFAQDADVDFNQDDDSESEKSDKDNESGSESDDESEEDEEELELLREYAKIKKEREEEQRRREEEKMEELKRQQKEAILTANPLLNAEQQNKDILGGYSLKKRWYEETVFKNQQKTIPKEKKRFINDTVRSDFHRKFLNRFIQ